MQRFEFLRQPLMGELAMSPEREKERGEKNAIYSGQLRLCQQPRAAHALRSDQWFRSNLMPIRSSTQKLTGLQSRASRLSFQIRKRDWHRGDCLTQLDWLSVPQMAAQSTIKLATKTLQNKNPENLYDALVDNNGYLQDPSETVLKNRTLRLLRT